MFKRELIIMLVGFVLLIGTSYYFFHKDTVLESENVNPNEESITVGGVDLLVDIADEPDEQTQGLSDRDMMAENKGMLFVFPEPLIPGFWMKDMLFSLDMLWIDSDLKVIAITKNISPDTYPNIFRPPFPVLYVLEVNAGWSDRNNIKVGDKIEF